MALASIPSPRVTQESHEWFEDGTFGKCMECRIWSGGEPVEHELCGVEYTLPYLLAPALPMSNSILFGTGVEGEPAIRLMELVSLALWVTQDVLHCKWSATS